MRILLVLLAVAVGAVLLVSATMGAETLVPGGESSKIKPRGGVTSSGKARIVPLSFSPLALKGSGFRPGENVTIAVHGGSTKATRRVKASASGSFVARLLGARIDRCNGITVSAVGDKGSRTGFQFSQLLCAVSGSRP